MSTPLVELRRMRVKQFLTDAVIMVNGSKFHVHKLVMCSCSPFFKDLFTTWSTPDNIVFYVPNITVSMMQVFINFAYTGYVSVNKDNVHELFIAADRFQVEGVTLECCKELSRSLSPQTCFDTWRITKDFYYPELKREVLDFILNRFENLLATPGFLQLFLEDLMVFIDSDDLNVQQERAVFEAIMIWINHSPQDRQEHLQTFLSKIRLSFMDGKYFTDHILGNELIRQNRKLFNHLIQSMKQMLDIQQGRPIRTSPCRPRVPRDAIVAIGGWNIEQPTNAIEIFNKHTKRWVPLYNPDPIPRSYHGAFFLGGCVYVIGGFGGEDSFCTMHDYDLARQTWCESAPMHVRRCYVSVTFLDGFIYAIGGFDGRDRLRTAERYSPETNQWRMITPMHERRSDASAAPLNGQIYICGGFTGDTCLMSAESYNPQHDQWTMIPQMSSPRSGLCVAAYAGEIYVIGGFNGVNRVSSLEAFNPQNNRWRFLPAMTHPRSNFGTAVLDDELYVVGGYSGDCTTNSVEKYNFRSGEWVFVSSMEVSRSALSCCVVRHLPNMAALSGTMHLEDSNET